MIYVDNCLIEQGHFPDHTLVVKLPKTSLSNKHWIAWVYENDAELFTLICLRRALDERQRGCTVDLFMEYIPHARMDRVQNSEDVFTLKYFCEVINSLNFANVYVRDPHSNVSTALLNNVKVEMPKIQIKEAIGQCSANAIFFPDAGAMKRYSDMSNGLPVAYGLKDRDWTTGKINGLTVVNGEAVKGKDVLIVDDVCSRGGTFACAAKALREAGAEHVYLYVTHLEENVLTGELANPGLIDGIFTTRTIAITWDTSKCKTPIRIL